MKKIYELKKSKYITMLIVALAILLCLLLDRSFNKPLLKIIGISSSLFWIFLGFPFAMADAIQISESGLSSMYVFQKKIFKIRNHISWENIASITTNRTGMCFIIPKNTSGNPSTYFKDAIVIPKNIKNYKELMGEIIANAKTATIDNSIKLQL